VALLVSPQTWCVLILIPPFPLSYLSFLSTVNVLPHFMTYANTKRNAHQEEYFALDDAELQHVITILKLLALGAHKVCCALHVSSFAYDSLSHPF